MYFMIGEFSFLLSSLVVLHVCDRFSHITVRILIRSLPGRSTILHVCGRSDAAQLHCRFEVFYVVYP